MHEAEDVLGVALVPNHDAAEALDPETRAKPAHLVSKTTVCPRTVDRFHLRKTHRTLQPKESP
jgi:hypothetical protein